jgi:shikimate kinase
MTTKLIVLIGLKSSGKTSVGKILAYRLGRLFLDVDDLIEKIYATQHKASLSYQEIYQSMGENKFRQLEQQAISHLATYKEAAVIATGGGSLLSEKNAAALSKQSVVIYLQAEYDTLLARWIENPPSFVDRDNIPLQCAQYYQEREKKYDDLANSVVCVDNKSLPAICDEVIFFLSTKD